MSKDFSSFSTTLSIALGQKDNENSSATVRFYADGEVRREVSINGKTRGVPVDLDLTGVRRLTIQLDPENAEGEGVSTDWAKGDIVTFGNAKFTKSPHHRDRPAGRDRLSLRNIINPKPDACLSVDKDHTVSASDPASGVHFMNKDDPGKDNSDSTYGASLSEKVTFQHWLRIEPLVAQQVGWITGASDPEGAAEIAYRNQFVNGARGKKFLDYSSITRNIDGRGYDQFKCTLGPRWDKQASATTTSRSSSASMVWRCSARTSAAKPSVPTSIST